MDNNNFNQTPMQPMQPVDPGKGKALAALILGLVSCVFCWISVGAVIPLVLGIVGAIMSSQYNKVGDGTNKSMATAGLVLSIIGIVLSAIFLVCGICTVCTVCTAASTAGGYSALYY